MASTVVPERFASAGAESVTATVSGGESTMVPTVMRSASGQGAASSSLLLRTGSRMVKQGQGGNFRVLASQSMKRQASSCAPVKSQFSMPPC
jgi:hypothetical protein